MTSLEEHFRDIWDSYLATASSLGQLKADLKATRAAVEPLINPPAPTPVPQPTPNFPVSAPFQPGGKYDWMPVAYRVKVPWLNNGDLTTYQLPNHKQSMGCFPFQMGSHQDAYFQTFEDPALHHRVQWANSGATPWGDHGPLWYHRMYNVAGALEDVQVWRVGDFHKGREGHQHYYNVMGSLWMQDIVSIQAGGQPIQIVLRPEETKYTGQWPADRVDSTINLKRLVFIDPGVINEGAAVRASWPLSFFSTGHKRVSMNDYFLHCNHGRPFFDSSSGLWCKSHGGFLFEQNYGRRAELIQMQGVYITLQDSDRSVGRVASTEEFHLNHGKIRSNAKNQIVVLNDVSHFWIGRDMDWTGDVVVYDVNQPWRSPLHVQQHQAGQETDIQPDGWSL